MNVKREELLRGLTADGLRSSSLQSADTQAVPPRTCSPRVGGRGAEQQNHTVVLAGFLARKAMKPVLLEWVKGSVPVLPGPAAASSRSPAAQRRFTGWMQRGTAGKPGFDCDTVSK